MSAYDFIYTNDAVPTWFKDVMRQITGDIITDVADNDSTGNVTGNVTGNLTGAWAGSTVVTLAVAGPTAVVPAVTNVLVLDGTSAAAAATIAAPAAGHILVIQCADGTNDCTVTLTAGTFDGTNEIATFADTNDALVLIGLSATRYLILINTGSVALSTAA